MNKHTGTVESLSAEIRVLMIDSRQVTLSMYRQLDEVEWETFCPFGRINDRTQNGFWMVGNTGPGTPVVKCHIPDDNVDDIWLRDQTLDDFQEEGWSYPARYPRDFPLIVLAGLT